MMDVRSVFSRLSISTRLALWYGLSLLFLLTVFVVGLYTVVHVGLHRTFDERLRHEAETVRDHLRAHGPDAHALSLSPSQRAAGPHKAFIRLIDGNGDVVTTSSSRRRRAFEPRLPATRTSEMRRHNWDGRAAQTLYLPIETAHSAARWVEVTKLESGLHRQLHELRWLLVLGILVGATGAVGIGYGLARRALRPVAELTDAAQSMMDRPTGTLPTDFGVKDELADLAETFNTLFRRLRAMVRRERRFRADAAHKMFTPLTAIQNEIDVSLRSERSPDAYRDTLERVRNHTDEVSSMLDRLMTLSRAEGRDEGPAAIQVNVTARVRTRVDRVRARAEETDVRLVVEGPDGVMLPVKPDHFDTIVDALVDNALKYTGEGGTVTVRVARESDCVRLTVSDTGIGFDRGDAERLFERFYRGDGAAEVARGGGLGLSVVKALVHSYLGTVSADSGGVGEGSTFEVCLPKANGA